MYVLLNAWLVRSANTSPRGLLWYRAQGTSRSILHSLFREHLLLLEVPIFWSWLSEEKVHFPCSLGRKVPVPCSWLNGTPPVESPTVASHAMVGSTPTRSCFQEMSTKPHPNAGPVRQAQQVGLDEWAVKKLKSSPPVSTYTWRPQSLVKLAVSELRARCMYCWCLFTMPVLY